MRTVVTQIDGSRVSLKVNEIRFLKETVVKVGEDHYEGCDIVLYDKTIIETIESFDELDTIINEEAEEYEDTDEEIEEE